MDSGKAKRSEEEGVAGKVATPLHVFSGPLQCTGSKTGGSSPKQVMCNRVKVDAGARKGAEREGLRCEEVAGKAIPGR